MRCAVCLWTREGSPNTAITICNGIAVCAGHFHLTTSDPTVAIARDWLYRKMEPYDEGDMKEIGEVCQ